MHPNRVAARQAYGDTAPTLQNLAQLIRNAEGQAGCGAREDMGDASVDAGWGGVKLARGVIHEWFAGPTRAEGRSDAAFPSLCIFIHLARMAIAQQVGKCVVWVGGACFPYAKAFSSCSHKAEHVQRDAKGAGYGRDGMGGRSIFVNPPSEAARLWSIDLALRCPGVGVVIADGSGLDMAASRRLQLAAQAGRSVNADGGGRSSGALALIARPARELGELSAAATRWRVEPESREVGAEDTGGPRWTVHLLRCKGLQPAIQEASRHFVVEWNHAQGLVTLPADVRGGLGAAARADQSAKPIRRTA